MPLNHRQAFKVGFLLKCAEDGLTQEETQQLIEKMASWATEAASITKDMYHLITGAGSLGLALGGGLGAAGGYGLARLTEPDNDPEEAKVRELISTYDQFADRAKRRASRYSYRQPALK